MLGMIENKKTKAIVAILILLFIFIGAVKSAAVVFNSFEASREQNQLFQDDASIVARKIDKNKNILFRSYFIEQSIYKLGDKGTILNVFEMKKEDAIKYLAWENDPVKILKRYNIKYIFRYKNDPNLEYGYYPWLKETFNKDLKYLDGIRIDTRIKEIYNGKEIIAYEIMNY